MPTTLRDYLASLPNAGGTLDADDKLPALEDGTLVGATAAQIGAGGGATGSAGGVLSGTYPNPGFAADMATQAELDAVAAAKLSLVAGGAAVENIGAVEWNVETANVSGTKTADTSVYGVFNYTMTANTTFTFSNPAPSGKMTTFELWLYGAFTPTLPAAVDWPDATAATYTTPSVYVFSTVDAGTTWLGRQIGKAFG